MYQTHIQPHFDYCAMVWGNYNRTLKEKLQKLWNEAARMITGDDYDVPSETILSKLEWKPLEERRKSQTISYMSNVLKRNCPQSISKIVPLVNNETYNLRSNDKILILSKPKTKVMKRSFGYVAAKTWNTHLWIHIREYTFVNTHSWIHICE